jgi:tRNA(Ile2) C34 agmatinyltransferase TiaS
MRLLKLCPMCLGDMTVGAILRDVESRCTMCGYRSPAEARPAGLARNLSSGWMTLPQQDWPYASSHLRRDRPHIVA